MRSLSASDEIEGLLCIRYIKEVFGNMSLEARQDGETHFPSLLGSMGKF